MMWENNISGKSVVLSPWDINTLDESFDILISHGMLRRYRAEKVLFQEGENSDVLFYLVNGKVKLTMSYPHGSELLLAIYKGRNFIGASVIDGLPFYATATTLSDSNVVTIPLKKIKELMRSNELLANALTESLCRTNRRLAGQVYCVAMTDASARVIGLLCNSTPTNNLLLCTHNDIASLSLMPLNLSDVVLRNITNLFGITHFQINSQPFNLNNQDAHGTVPLDAMSATFSIQ